MTHTPKPWKIIGQWIIGNEHHGYICEWSGKKDNAYLIAAAPELLEDGDELARLCIQSERYTKDIDFQEAVDNMFHSVRKARQESHENAKEQRTKALLTEGTWKANDIRRIFVAGAKWWEFEKSSATMWASDVEKAEKEAERRYPNPY